MSGRYKVGWLCEALMVSRSGYYDWCRRQHTPGPRQRANLQLRERIRAVFVENRRAYGSPRIAEALQGAASRNRVFLLTMARIWAAYRTGAMRYLVFRSRLNNDSRKDVA